MSMQELVDSTGLAYATVKKVVLTDKSVRKIEGFPMRFDIDPASSPSGVEIPWTSKLGQLKETGLTIAVPKLQSVPNVATLYANIVHLIPMALPAKLEAAMDPAELAAELGNYAIFLANLSAQVAAYATDPGWYRALGGEA